MDLHFIAKFLQRQNFKGFSFVDEVDVIYEIKKV